MLRTRQTAASIIGWQCNASFPLSITMVSAVPVLPTRSIPVRSPGMTSASADVFTIWTVGMPGLCRYNTYGQGYSPPRGIGDGQPPIPAAAIVSVRNKYILRKNLRLLNFTPCIALSGSSGSCFAVGNIDSKSISKGYYYQKHSRYVYISGVFSIKYRKRIHQ